MPALIPKIPVLFLCAAAIVYDMPCYSPLTAYRSAAGRLPNGKWPIVFKRNQGYSDMPVTVPCGQCIGCRLERSRQWAIRCLHEASLHKDNCFLTLTYNSEHLPKNGSLDKHRMVKFMKDLRKKFGAGIRFFQCGEYGEEFNRPHHHVLLFNFTFPDKKYYCSRNKNPIYRSAALEKLWPDGFASIGSVTFESAAYVARYITKKLLGPTARDTYESMEKTPEYVTMSRRPGIGRGWLEKYSSDVYPGDLVHIRPGVMAKPPKYYDKIFDLTNPEQYHKIKIKRVTKAKNSPDNSMERLLIRERLKRIRCKELIRPLENPNLTKRSGLTENQRLLRL